VLFHCPREHRLPQDIDPPRHDGSTFGTQLNDVSSSAIDSLWNPAPPSNSTAELSTKTHKPVLKRFDEILGSQAFNNLVYASRSPNR
jgi:hypothetical protein